MAEIRRNEVSEDAKQADINELTQHVSCCKLLCWFEVQKN